VNFGSKRVSSRTSCCWRRQRKSLKLPKTRVPRTPGFGGRAKFFERLFASRLFEENTKNRPNFCEARSLCDPCQARRRDQRRRPDSKVRFLRCVIRRFSRGSRQQRLSECSDQSPEALSLACSRHIRGQQGHIPSRPPALWTSLPPRPFAIELIAFQNCDVAYSSRRTNVSIAASNAE
jgi:hypothetical protein